MKTAPFMVMFLPRFRWFVWGFALAATLFNFLDGYASPGVLILFVLGAITYISESANRRLIANAAKEERSGRDG